MYIFEVIILLSLASVTYKEVLCMQIAFLNGHTLDSIVAIKSIL